MFYDDLLVLWNYQYVFNVKKVSFVDFGLLDIREIVECLLTSTIDNGKHRLKRVHESIIDFCENNRAERFLLGSHAN